MAQTGDTPEAPNSGDQEGLHYKAPQNLFYTRPLISRPGDIVDLPNTEKHTQR